MILDIFTLSDGSTQDSRVSEMLMLHMFSAGVRGQLSDRRC